jgi:hypothetical protein
LRGRDPDRDRLDEGLHRQGYRWRTRIVAGINDPSLQGNGRLAIFGNARP